MQISDPDGILIRSSRHGLCLSRAYSLIRWGMVLHWGEAYLMAILIFTFSTVFNTLHEMLSTIIKWALLSMVSVRCIKYFQFKIFPTKGRFIRSWRHNPAVSQGTSGVESKSLSVQEDSKGKAKDSLPWGRGVKSEKVMCLPQKQRKGEALWAPGTLAACKLKEQWPGKEWKEVVCPEHKEFRLVV